MGGISDFEELLSTGSWTTSQARSRASSSNRDSDPHPRPRIPRASITTRSRKRYPPPASCEEESDSLAREYGSSAISSDESPQYIGDIDQNPVLLEVAENNPERRFVLLTQPQEQAPKKPAAAGSRKSAGAGITPPVVEAGGVDGSRPTSSRSSSSSPVKGCDPSRDGKGQRPGRSSWNGRKRERGVDEKRTSLNGLNGASPGTPTEKGRQQPVEPIIEKRAAHTPDRKAERKAEQKATPERKVESMPRRRMTTKEEERPVVRKKDRSRSDYEANTCRKYVLVPTVGSRDERRPVSPAKQKFKERKSRQDLPPIETKNTNPKPHESRSSRHSRDMSSTEIKQEPGNLFEPEHTPRQAQDFLSPAVVKKHSTKWRKDEEYYDENRGSDVFHRRGGSFHETKSSPLERKDLSRLNRERDSQSSSPVASKRTPSSPHFSREHRPDESRGSHRRSRRELASRDSARDSVRDSNKDSTRYSGEQYRDDGTSRHPDRTVSIPAYIGAASTASDILVRRTPSHRQSSHQSRHHSRRGRRESPPSDAIASSSEEDRVPYPQSPHRAPRDSFVDYPEERGFLLMPAGPDEEIPATARDPSPLSSPLIPSSADFADPHRSDLRGAFTFPETKERHHSGWERPPSPAGRDPSPPSHRSAEPYEDIYRISRPKSRGPVPNIINVSAPLIANPSFGDRPRSPIVDPYRHSAPILNPWQPPKFNTPKSKTLTYRNFLQGATDGSFEALPACPRMKPEAGFHGWLTLPRLKDFTICPSCYESVFEHTRHGSAFIPMPFQSPNIETACSFGCSYWYQIAWFLTLKYAQPDLRIPMSLADIVATNPPCPGTQLSKQIWYAIRDPFSRELVPGFCLCGTCVKVVGALLPVLAKSFKPLHSYPTEGYCVLGCESSSKDTKFLEYFDAMESVADVSMKNRVPADIQELSDQVQFILTVSKCPQDIPLRDRNWYFMRSIPELTVCGECFTLVVKPWVEAGNAVAKDFYRRSNHVPLATCQLYSQRMREVFDKACDRRGLGYLDRKVKERKLMEGDIKAKIHTLVSKPLLSSWEEDELDRLSHEWAEWE